MHIRHCGPVFGLDVLKKDLLKYQGAMKNLWMRRRGHGIAWMTLIVPKDHIYQASACNWMFTEKSQPYAKHHFERAFVSDVRSLSYWPHTAEWKKEPCCHQLTEEAEARRRA